MRREELEGSRARMKAGLPADCSEARKRRCAKWEHDQCELRDLYTRSETAKGSVQQGEESLRGK